MTDRLRPTLVQITGAHRGSTHLLEGPRLRVGTGADAEIHFPADREPEVAPRHAELHREAGDWILEAASDGNVYLNGERVSSERLLPGDVLQLGTGGPLLRYRLQPSSGSEYKSLRDALADCVACARYGADTLPERTAQLLRVMPGELMTQTSPWVRASMAGALLLSLGLTTYLFLESRNLDRRLSDARARVEAVSDSFRGERQRLTVSPDHLDSLRRMILAGQERERKESRDALSEASRAVILIQGDFGFKDPSTGRPVRLRGSREPRTASGPDRPSLGHEVEAPPLEQPYTGTAFAVSGDLIVTNRHLVRPWSNHSPSRSLMELGYIPEIRRLTGFLPGRPQRFQLEIVAVSDSADLALLRAPELEGELEGLPLAERTPRVGDDVHLLGYPTGVKALLARSDPAFVTTLHSDTTLDPWSLTSRVAEDGSIAPLVTRGIVGQVTGSTIVYDAETAQGGSGGPVLGPEGRVVAVNMGLMPEFGGSNLGVPVRYVRRLLAKAPGSR